LAACLFLIAYSNMIGYNLTSDFHSIKTAKSRDAGYGDYRAHDLSTYLVSQGHILLTLLRLPPGAVDERPEAAAYLGDALILLYDGFVVAGLVLLARAGNALLALVIVSSVLVLPMFGAHHDVLPRQGRYLAPLLPLMFCALASAV